MAREGTPEEITSREGNCQSETGEKRVLDRGKSLGGKYQVEPVGLIWELGVCHSSGTEWTRVAALAHAPQP